MPRTGRPKPKKATSGDVFTDLPSSTSGPESIADAPTPVLEGRSNKKLDYSRVSVACSRCRRRKMRCEPFGDDPMGPCKKCIDSKKQCNYEPVDHATLPTDTSLQRGPPDPMDNRSTTSIHGHSFNRSELYGHGTDTSSAGPSSYRQSPEPYVSSQPFTPFPDSSRELPYHLQQDFSPGRPRYPFGDINSRSVPERDYYMQAGSYGSSFHSGITESSQHIPGSSYTAEAPHPHSAYVTSTPDTWRDPQPSVATQNSFDGSHLIYPPPTEYNPFGVPRRAATVPHSSSPNPMATGSGNILSHHPQGQYIAIPANDPNFVGIPEDPSIRARTLQQEQHFSHTPAEGFQYPQRQRRHR